MANSKSMLSFDTKENFLYANLDLPIVFITEYMANMDGELAKVYIYFLFLNKYKKKISISEIAKKFNMSSQRVRDIINNLKSLELIDVKDNKLELTDLKEREINRLCRLTANKISGQSSNDNATRENEKREQVISAISEVFFQGMMSTSWYGDIIMWFDMYKFDGDVMYTLFQHCYDRRALSKNYIMKVAESWKNKNITNALELDSYYMQYQETKTLGQKIAKKLRLSRNLTEYEDEYIDIWLTQYQYKFDVIEIALRLTRTRNSPSFEYIHKVLTDWNNKNLKTKEQVLQFIKNSRRSYSKNITSADVLKQLPSQRISNFSQTQFEEEDYEGLYENLQSCPKSSSAAK